jgi:uncharacterized protein YecT (DUF1311 family)
MTKRDYLLEIAAVRARNQHDHAVADLHIRLLQLDIAFSNRDKVQTEYLKYLPIAVIACLEAYSRAQIKEMIDRGAPFASRAAGLDLPPVKFDPHLLSALGGQDISLGDLISHLLSINNLDDLNAHISKLTEQDFLACLKTVHDRWAVEVKKEPRKPIIDDPAEVLSGLKRCFELRHIFAHEMASAAKVEKQEIERCFNAGVTFLRAMVEYCTNLLNPDAPLTQTDMNIKAGMELERANAELDALISEFEALLEPSRRADFQRVQEKWSVFREQYAEFESKVFEGGSIRPMIHAQAARKATHRRIKDLRIELQNAKRYAT